MIARPRLLPLTIAALALALGTRSVLLVRAAGSAEPGPTSAAPAAGAPQPQPTAPLPSAMDPAAPPPAVAPVPRDQALLADLRRRRAELDRREAALAMREAVAAAADKRLAARLDELASLQGRLEALERARQQRTDVDWAGLVRLYAAMKPREAAAIFNDLDSAVLLQVVDRMKETKAAPILAAMLPDRARQLTADLAQLRARANQVPDPPARAPARAPAGAP